MDLKRKAQFVVEQLDQLQSFLKMLEELKSREKLLSFEPMSDPHAKLAELQALKQIHAQQVCDSERQAGEVEQALVAYNEIVEQVTQKIMYLQAERQK